MPQPSLYSIGDVVFLKDDTSRPFVIKNIVYVGGTREYDCDLFPANKRTLEPLKRGWRRWEYQDDLIPYTGLAELKQKRILNKIKYLDQMFLEKKHVRV